MQISHDEQKKRWDEEHSRPFALKQMDARKGSSALKPLMEFLEKEGKTDLIALEMGCGKGRNVIWLAQQPQFRKVYGFDFSVVAIEESKRRADESEVVDKTDFREMDATLSWAYPDAFFDVGIDCTASVDIETPEGRMNAREEMKRVVKPGGHFLVYVMSTDDEYHKNVIEVSPAKEQNAFLHPITGKFEKVFSPEELDEMYKNFTLIEARRIQKTSEFFGQSYASSMHWRIYRK